tara:strand:- start:74 stop:568 length:495 start_codon:yes stop_codon:yes gene_type:complete
MAKNNSPLNYSGSWAREDADRAKKLYAEGDDAHAHALGRDEHAADYGTWSGTHEAWHGHTGNSKWAKGAPTMWETGSQISKHMNHHLWGEARRELMDDPLEEDMTGKRAGVSMKSPLNEQGYAAREDESIGARVGHEDTEQSWKDRRDESYSEWGHRPDQSIKR